MGLEEIKAKISAHIESEIEALENAHKRELESFQAEQGKKREHLEEHFQEKKRALEESHLQNLRIYRNIEEKRVKLQNQARYFETLFEESLMALEKSSVESILIYVERCIQLTDISLENTQFEFAECHKAHEKELINELALKFPYFTQISWKPFRGGFKLKSAKAEYNLSFEKQLSDTKESLILWLMDLKIGVEYE